MSGIGQVKGRASKTARSTEQKKPSELPKEQRNQKTHRTATVRTNQVKESSSQSSKSRHVDAFTATPVSHMDWSVIKGNNPDSVFQEALMALRDNPVPARAERPWYDKDVHDDICDLDDRSFGVCYYDDFKYQQ